MVKNLVASYRAARSKSKESNEGKELDALSDAEQDDVISIGSLPTNRSDRIKMIDGWKESYKKKNDFSDMDSVLSDITFNAPTSTPKLEISGSAVGKPSTHEFIVECDSGERIFVPSLQGMVIKSRCRQLQKLLECNSNSNPFCRGVQDSDTVSQEEEHRIITKKTWSARAARHVIELLAEGITWIENNEDRFVELLRACDEIKVRLHLGSPINYHDVLDPASTIRYFKLADSQKYRFQLAGVFRSSQWMYLLKKGILLQSDSNVLMLSSEPTNEQYEDSKAIQQRLSKCDNLYLDYSVHSNKSTISVLYNILNLLSNNDDKLKKDKGNQSAYAETFEETIQIVCKTAAGKLSEKDWNMFWRVTSSSYALATPEEELLLQTFEDHSRKDVPVSDIRICQTESTEKMSDTESETSHAEDPIYDESSQIENSCRSFLVKYETRTITGTSFVALKHLFRPVNPSDKSSPDDPALLPACLSIANPTPDTLGRFLNACANTSGKISYTTRIGYDILPPVSSSSNGKHSIMFFVTNTSKRIKEILGDMAEYSGASDVGDADFRLEQLRHG